MIQCFSQHNFEPVFSLNDKPTLISASNIHKDFSKHPRILHKHDDRFELLLIREGSGFYYVEDNYYPIEKGDIILCNCSVLHDEIPGEKSIISSYSLAVDNLHFGTLPLNHLLPKDHCPVLHTGCYFSQLESLLKIIFELLSSKNNTDEACQHLTISILTLLVNILNNPNSSIVYKDSVRTSATEKKESSKLVFTIKNYLDEHYREDLCLREISDMFNIDSYYLAHIFKKILGYSPMQYVYRRRIGEAQSLLICSEMSITSIASYVGFGNPNNFNIQFKKYVGISPRAYRVSYTKNS